MGPVVAAGAAGYYGSFLKAQETSPTLILAHANIGDSGALEVAHFVSKSAYLLRLDLTGCNITSEGAMHLAEALRCSLTLESLVLRHNAITAGPAGEAGLAAVCSAARSSPSLRHLDLRHNGLTGVSAATHIGSILQGNLQLSHLELSWNPLGPPGGQVLLDNIRATTGLFDCQLTGCRLAQQTMLDIAQYLLRNRKVKEVDIDPGPYKGGWVKNDGDLDKLEREDGQSRARLIALRTQGKAAAANYADRFVDEDVPGNAVVSKERTEELIQKLLNWRTVHLERSTAATTGAGTARVQELLEYLDEFQRETEGLNKGAEDSKRRVELITQGFQDRELRYRENLATGRDRLLEFSKEYSKMQAQLGRMVDDLSLNRDDLEVAREDLKRAQRNAEDDEDRDKGKLALLTGERKDLERRLRDLHDRGEHLDVETKMLRKRAERVREGVINELEA